MNKLELQKTANEVRKGIITAVHGAKAGHPGGSLSAADLFTYLYFEEMNVDPKDPKKADRDRFVLSKGHTAPGLYSTLANRGYFPVEDLPTLRHLGSYLQGHPCMQETPGVDMSSGSLGQGISAAVGMAVMLILTELPWGRCLLTALVTSLLGAYTELISRNGDDTLTVPVANVAVILVLQLAFAG